MLVTFPSRISLYPVEWQEQTERVIRVTENFIKQNKKTESSLNYHRSTASVNFMHILTKLMTFDGVDRQKGTLISFLFFSLLY